MLELFGWNMGMTGFAVALLIVAAVVIGLAAQYIGEVTFGYEWTLTAVAALIGGWLGSEAFGSASPWGPQWEGMFLLPALIGAIVLGGLFDIAVRYVSGGAYVHHPRPI
jgi:uncharacterized membrane protein YeaQ/YmgE (transglycosylase-associated protein family)